MIEQLIRPELRSYIPYDANQQPYKVKLDANESPFNMPENVRIKLADYIKDNPELYLYPDSDSNELRNVLAEYWNINKDGILVGTGSDQLIQVITNVFIGCEDKVLFPAPSFSMYKDACIIAGGIPVKYTLGIDNGYSYSKELIKRAYDEEHPKLVYICNPNNPTGNIMSKEDVLDIVRYCTKAIVIVDEAYAEFCDVSVIPYINQYENLLVLKTFSKAYGLAGLRCGYSLSCAKLAKAVKIAKPPYNISSLSQKIAMLMLEEQKDIQSKVDYLNRERDWLSTEISKINGVKVYPSYANFLLVKIENSVDVYKRLCEKGILVRAFGTNPLLYDCLRLSIGTHEHNTILLDELISICYNK